jgi:hypothetical protein
VILSSKAWTAVRVLTMSLRPARSTGAALKSSPVSGLIEETIPPSVYSTPR